MYAYIGGGIGIEGTPGRGLTLKASIYFVHLGAIEWEWGKNHVGRGRLTYCSQVTSLPQVKVTISITNIDF